MASFVWMSVFILLVLELIVTFVLVVPIPRKYRNVLAKRVFQWDLGTRLKKPILFIGIGLCLALIESYMTQQRFLARLNEGSGGNAYGMEPHQHFHNDLGSYGHMHNKERKYKAERNLYLASFSLTLLFVINRITTLMQESVELCDETEGFRHTIKDIAHSSVTAAHHARVEASASAAPKNTQEKKKD